MPAGDHLARRRAVWRAALLAALAPAALGSQQPDGMRPLAIPSGLVLRCRVVPSERASASRPGLIAREYELRQTGSISERWVEVAHDSAGRQVYLMEMTALASLTAPEIYTFVVHFRSRGGVEGFADRMDTATVRPRTPPTGARGGARTTEIGRPLNPEEIANARALADWLWARRCARPGASR